MSLAVFKGGYLRITTPETTNGIIPATNEQGQVKTFETFLPLSARKHMERENARLEKAGHKHLKHKIETVGA